MEQNISELKAGFLKNRTDAIETAYSVLFGLYHPATKLPQGPRVYTLEELLAAVYEARLDRLEAEQNQ